jgi:hypothetical protein
LVWDVDGLISVNETNVELADEVEQPAQMPREPEP